ncbi:MAG: type II toxin-antitoxin system HicA family toxin [Prolixibacteraceae bacterium]|nr:type II toxin-antitoxin system HicA family toxin [Prolixibacteraceae bacterium]
MAKLNKILIAILSGYSDNNIKFFDLLNVLKHLGFTLRIRGSHHILFKDGIDEILNLQPNNDNAKSYQVKQVRNLILKYQLKIEDDE